MSNFERIISPDETPRASKRKTRTGIKAIITVSDLQSVVNAAKQWQNKLTEDGKDASKLLHHIANAEQVLVKYRNRNKLAYERRRANREQTDEFEKEEQGERFDDAPIAPVPQKPTPELGKSAWNILTALGFPSKKEEPKEEPKGAARPTRW